MAAVAPQPGEDGDQIVLRHGVVHAQKQDPHQYRAEPLIPAKEGTNGDPGLLSLRLLLGCLQLGEARQQDHIDESGPNQHRQQPHSPEPVHHIAKSQGGQRRGHGPNATGHTEIHGIARLGIGDAQRVQKRHHGITDPDGTYIDDAQGQHRDPRHQLGPQKSGADRGQRQHHGDQDAPFGPVRQGSQNGLSQAGAKARQTQQQADGTGIHALFQ